MRLWSKKQEKIFFDKSKNFASHQQLFYRTDDGRYVAYWPKGYDGANKFSDWKLHRKMGQ